MNENYLCPGCKQTVAFIHSGPDLYRCSYCRWLTRLDGNRMVTRFAVQNGPTKSKGIRVKPTDPKRLDAILAMRVTQ